MVAAVHFVAVEDDEQALLDRLGEPDRVALLTWPRIDRAAPPLGRHELAGHTHLTVARHDLGRPVLVATPEDDPDDLPASGILARFRRHPPRPAPGPIGLVDSNASPVLLWRRACPVAGVLGVSDIGSQADALGAVGDEYRRWVEQTTAWIRRRGTKVWGLERSSIRPDLDVDLRVVTTVYALPAALARLTAGARLR